MPILPLFLHLCPLPRRMQKLWSHVQERQPLPHVSVTDDLAGCPIGQVLQRVQSQPAFL